MAIDFKGNFTSIVQNLNVRISPSTSAKIIDSLKIGEFVTISDTSDFYIKLKAIKLPFVKISYTRNGLKYSGYTWLGYLTNKYLKIDEEFYFAYLNKIGKERNSKNQKLYINLDLLDSKSNTTTLIIDSLNNSIESELVFYLDSSNTFKDFKYEISLESSQFNCCASYDRFTIVNYSNNLMVMPKLSWTDQCGDGVSRKYIFTDSKNVINYKVIEGNFFYINEEPFLKWTDTELTGTLNKKKLGGIYILK